MSEQGWYWIAAVVLVLGISSEVASRPNSFGGLACNLLASIEHIPGPVGRAVAVAEASLGRRDAGLQAGQLAMVRAQSRLSQFQVRLDRRQAEIIRRQAEHAAFMARRQAEHAGVWATECAEKEVRAIPVDDPDMF